MKRKTYNNVCKLTKYIEEIGGYPHDIANEIAIKWFDEYKALCRGENIAQMRPIESWLPNLMDYSEWIQEQRQH